MAATPRWRSSSPSTRMRIASTCGSWRAMRGRRNWRTSRCMRIGSCFGS
jgi:hypothetical protein